MTGRLLVVTGLPGVGKTAVAREIAGRVDGRLIRTDVVRTDCFEDPEYTAHERATVYDEVFARARKTLSDGGAAVLDGTFRKRSDRARAAGLAAELDASLGVVAVECEPSVAEARIAAREGDESDADVEVYREFRERYEPIELPHVTVDNSGAFEATRDRLDALLQD
ncbi:AAA family ATPase [Halobellus sp. Atlit-31R]|nr:AAA family ATPase [Halobellus sp. Atlit-31R]